MDFLCKHFGGRSRPLQLVPAVASIGVLPRKTEWIKGTFGSFNLSFILEGRGEYHYRGVRYRVEAPMVLTQWPGEAMDYGPNCWWSEIYAIYPPQFFDCWRQAGIDVHHQPLWPVNNIDRFNVQLRRLLEILATPMPEALELDLCLYGMAGISLEPGEQPQTPEMERLQLQRQLLQRDLQKHPDYRRLARQLGMSEATLRRRWQELQHLPPGRDRSQRQREKACRLLVESTLPVKQIAAECGFSDALYFSRRFRMWMGDTPTQYRRKYTRNFG